MSFTKHKLNWFGKFVQEMIRFFPNNYVFTMSFISKRKLARPRKCIKLHNTWIGVRLWGYELIISGDSLVDVMMSVEMSLWWGGRGLVLGGVSRWYSGGLGCLFQVRAPGVFAGRRSWRKRDKDLSEWNEPSNHTGWLQATNNWNFSAHKINR